MLAVLALLLAVGQPPPPNVVPVVVDDPGRRDVSGAGSTYSVPRKGCRKPIRHWESDRLERYDPAVELGEQRDLAGEHRDEARALDAELAARLAALGARLSRRVSGPNDGDGREEE